MTETCLSNQRDEKADRAFRLLRAAGDIHRLARAIEEAQASLVAVGKSEHLSFDVPTLKVNERMLDKEARGLLWEADDAVAALSEAQR